MNQVVATMKKSANKLVAVNRNTQEKLDEFRTTAEEGALVNIYMEVVSEERSTLQLARIHAMIRSLSNHTGYTYREMKDLVKYEAGIMQLSDDEVASFADCSWDEMSAAIEACIIIGIRVNHELK